jgi:hypothetical protein
MDPDATLSEMRELANDLGATGSFEGDADRLAELVQALDEWLSKGGFFPKAWRPF